MCEEYTTGIEHPNQDSWIAGLAGQMSEEQKAAMAARYVGVPEGTVDLPSLYYAVESATMINHAHRATHESTNRGVLGIGSIEDEGERGRLRAEYDQLTGRASKVHDFVLWFSRVSHAAFVDQEHILPSRRVKHVSLELGGNRQFGDWEATHALDEMARSIPSGILKLQPDARLRIYGPPREGSFLDDRIEYVDEQKPKYRLLPQYQLPSKVHQTQRTFDNHGYDDFVVFRRRRTVADIYVPGQSDVVIFKESLGMLVMSMIAPEMRSTIAEDCKQVFEAVRSKRDVEGATPVNLTNTPGAMLAGSYFEEDISSPAGVSKNTIVISAHYVAGVGEKFADRGYGIAA